MAYTSLTFLFIFLPLCFLAQLLCRSVRARNALLLLLSVAFYAWGEPVYVLLLLGSAVFNYFTARLLAAFPSRRKLTLVAVLCVDVGVLLLFKYAAFFIAALSSALQLSINMPPLPLPLGISFFTFQAISYIIDVYRGEIQAEKRFFRLLLYFLMFPQLLSGPLTRYADVGAQLESRTLSAKGAAGGMRRFIIGLSKKLLLADTLAAAANALYALPNAEWNALFGWSAAILYLFQIYFDFSGYADMAIGAGALFGVTLPENFNYPYAAVGLGEFWRRWHISLGAWFKSYVYIPLGGNRRGRARTVFNKFIVFLLTGLWHGASWTFVVWGAYQGVFCALEDTFKEKIKLPRILRRLWTLLLITAGFVLFRSADMAQALAVLGAMFTRFTVTADDIARLSVMITPLTLAALGAALLGCTPLCRAALSRVAAEKIEGVSHIVTILLLVLCMLYLSSSAYTPFIYFAF